MYKYATNLFLIFVFILTASLDEYHKFYVSVNQIDFNESKKRVEISSRLFIDDLNLALQAQFNQKFYVGTNLEKPEELTFLKKYFQTHLNIKINQKDKEIEFLSYEIEDDVLVCYLLISKINKISTLGIQNKLLIHAIPEQQNIIHSNINEIKKSVLLTKSQPRGWFDFN